MRRSRCTGTRHAQVYFLPMRRLVLALLFFATILRAQDYPLGPDSQPQNGVAKGTVTQYTLAPGKFYPGTPHTYSVYVPAQYDAHKPAPLMIFLDGSGFLRSSERAPVVLDNLIAKHDLPPLIGIFVDPGILPTLSDQAQNRYERIFEYDSMSDRYSRFLLQELIPQVGKKYSLSNDPNDRALCGVSTGAVGAFMAAWNRPDQFHRVLSFIGTYVSMKGADSLPALVRKTEPKPIRVFMQDGTQDHIVPAEPYGISYAGSWPINNQVMFQALQYSGYDVKLVMGEGGHNMNQGAAILPDALRWLWRDYPNPIVVHEPEAMNQPGWDPIGKVYSTVWASKGWEQVGPEYPSITGLASDKDGNVFFADPAENRIYKSGPDGKVTLFKDHSDGAQALRVGPDGRLYAGQSSREQIVSYGMDGGQQVVAQGVRANELAITARGTIYFADAANKTIGYIDRSGRPRVVDHAREMALPTGLGISPDQAMLVVTDAQSKYQWSFQIAPDGSLVNGEPFYRMETPDTGWRLEKPETAWMTGAKEVIEDTTGQVFFATPVGIQMCEQNGRVSDILNPPEVGEISSITFAGRDMNWLYAAEGGKLFRRPVKVSAAPVDAVIKPPKPRL
jgi:gluconolactonase